MTRVTKGSVGLREYQDRLKFKKKEILPPREKRAKKVNLDFRECQGSERKVNPENQDPEENLEKMVTKGKKGVPVFLVNPGTQDS